MVRPGKEHKIVDPRDGVLAATGDELLDASVVQRHGTWWMYVAGQAHGQGAPNIFSATLPPRVTLPCPLARRPAPPDPPWLGGGGRTMI